MTDIEALIRSIVRDELAKARPANDGSRYVTVAEYARSHSISASTVRDAIRDGRLDSIRIGRAVRVPAGAEIAAEVVDEATERARLTLLRSGRVR